ncbi:hypothetical protein BDZ89DRAFT_1051351 [Hymenopellis radicata]|nr:hypothetical protein BDZ89DRAFT_1051351 [Hymenopellis radicata]
MDSIWDETSSIDVHSETQWTQMSSDFTNTGYREGIIAGKESVLQEGFDAAFAQTGVPLGHQLGILRGTASVLVSVLSKQQGSSALLDDARSISSALANVRFSDIAPRDLEAEEHARQHLETEGVHVPEKVDQGLEDRLSAGAITRLLKLRDRRWTMLEHNLELKRAHWSNQYPSQSINRTIHLPPGAAGKLWQLRPVKVHPSAPRLGKTSHGDQYGRALPSMSSMGCRLAPVGDDWSAVNIPVTRDSVHLEM